MPHHHLALLGFGNVGQALARLLLRKRAELQQWYGLTFTVTGISTGRHGSAISTGGIDLEEALELISAGKSLETIAEIIPENSVDFIRRVPADVLFENSPVNYQNGQPAVDHLRQALQTGKHAITANKGPVVHAYAELTDLAARNNRRFFFESTVMDGAPIFSLFRSSLPGAQLLSFKGILNSTTNLILGRMEDGESFADAVGYAQQIGIAETDPSGDIDGWDAAIKVAALATVLMGIPVGPAEIELTGIRAITTEDVSAARLRYERYKLVCSAHREGNKVTGRVAPELVPASSPFYSVNGTTSCVEFETDILGPLVLIESNPGPDTTAYGLFADFLNAVL